MSVNCQSVRDALRGFSTGCVVRVFDRSEINPEQASAADNRGGGFWMFLLVIFGAGALPMVESLHKLYGQKISRHFRTLPRSRVSRFSHGSLIRTKDEPRTKPRPITYESQKVISQLTPCCTTNFPLRSKQQRPSTKPATQQCIPIDNSSI